MTKCLLEYPRHENGKTDKRYSCNWEFCGYSIPMLIVRWCDEYIGACHDELKANTVMSEHYLNRSL